MWGFQAAFDLRWSQRSLFHTTSEYLALKVFKNLNGWGNIINLFVCQISIYMLWEYLQNLLKSVFEYLRHDGQLLAILFDDVNWLWIKMSENANSTVCLLCKPDFVIHFDRSFLKPTPKIEFLGFDIDSVDMGISAYTEKQHYIILTIKQFLTNPAPRISYFFGLIEKI